MAHCPFILDLETHDTSFECGETGSVGEQGELASDNTDTNSPKVANHTKAGLRYRAEWWAHP